MFHAITPHVAWLKNLSRYSIALISDVWATTDIDNIIATPIFILSV